MKNLFSQRMGLTPVRTEIQRKSMDQNLRTGLWNIYYDIYRQVQRTGGNTQVQGIFRFLWQEYFHQPADDVPRNFAVRNDKIKEIFQMGRWYEVCDLIEAIMLYHPESGASKEFVEGCNRVLSQELAAYRIIDGLITEITSEQEIDAIEEAISISPNPVKEHLQQALQHFSDRQNPDYRNSIKESISAVESICKQIAGEPKGELKDALNKIERDGKVKIHGAQRQAFLSLYGWTSDGDGIRHALMDESSLEADDARFMLVTCSAFVNYLIKKANKAGIKL